jgi:ZIP family zinc transporter
VFSGILIYLATSHILPEAHARHASRWTFVSTLAGVAIMWGLVSQLHAVHVHSHDETSIEKGVEDEHQHVEEGHEEDDHDHDHNE